MGITRATDIAAMKGVGTRLAEALGSLGIRTVGDLIMHLPHRHEDFSVGLALSEVTAGVNVVVDATVTKVANRRSFRRRRMSITEAHLTDGETELKAVWFNQPYLVRTIREGGAYRFSGKASATKFGLQLVNPTFSRAEAMPEPEEGEELLPVYPLTTGVTQRTLRRLVAQAAPLIDDMADPLPPDIAMRYGLPPLSEALRTVHFPDDRDALSLARRRLAFDELFRLQLAVGTTRRQRERGRAPAIPFDEAHVKAFVASLPFTLTDDQRKAAWEIITDMREPRPMHRLLDGDVGSGKTAVAAVTAANVAAAGRQVAIMAPTEILAMQHFRSFTTLFANEDVSVALWTNAYKSAATGGKEAVAKGKADRERLAADIAGGEVDIVIGTHALVMGAFSFHDLALAVIDEQHRFGVSTRKALREKGGGAGEEPHLLSMTATPIPRTLALTVYGDLDISLLRQKPAGRLPVETKVVTPSARDRTYRFIRERLDEGRQAFFVCPLIDRSDAIDATSAMELHDRLRDEAFPGVTMAVLHGRMAAPEKERVMADFAGGRISILVSTSVVEVGVDVPNATIMCIEGAERFGLAQLHQFRGRVGRGEHGSHCFLFPGQSGQGAAERLKAMETTHDGFALAEKDLAIRGPGDILGEAQSGYLPALQMAAVEDMQLVKDAREAAEALLEADPDLAGHPDLRTMLDRAFEAAHLE